MMKLRILSAALFWVALVFQTHGQCTSGCSTTYTLSSSSQTLSFTVGSANQTICIVKGGAVSGNATITSGTFDINNRPNTVLCFGPGVVVSSSVNINNPNNQFTINNYGTLQNSISLSQTQNAFNNYGTVSGPVTMSNGTFNNNSGATFSSSNFAFNGGTFVNNTGSTFNIPGSFSAGNGTNFSGGGSFTVGGNFTTGSGSNASIGGAASITGYVQTNTPVNFGSSLSVGTNLTSGSGGAITVAGATTVGGYIQSNSAITFSSTVNVTGNLTSGSGGAISISGNATVGGAVQSNSNLSFGGSLAVTGNFTSGSGGPITIAGNTTIGGAVQTNSATTFSGSLSVTGAMNVGSGAPITVAGNTSVGGGLTTNGSAGFSGNLSVTGALQINSGAPITVSGTTNVTGTTTINAGSTFTGLATLGGTLSISSGAHTTFSSGGTVNGSFTNNATTTFNGTLSVTGSITNNSGAVITSASGVCKTLCGSSITNTGTISSTSGPNMNVCVTPSGGGTLTNTTVNVTPTAGPTGLGTSVSGSTVTGTFTAASPAPGGYIVLRKTSAFAPADMPVANTTYAVGNTIGGATVAALLTGSATSFTYSNGCGTFYFAVISSSNNSGSCGTFYTASYATSAATTVSCSGNRYWISSSASNWNSTSNWSVSSGGPSGASVPSTNNLAIYDNARNGNCSIDATVDVLGIQVSGYTGTITQNANPMTMGTSSYSQSSGTFTGGSSSITVNSTGTFTLSGGTFTSTSGNLTITGGRNSNTTLFTHSAGTFNHNNGTLVINPSLTGCANPTLTLDVIPATSFYNVTIDGVAGCGINASISTAAGDVINATNTLNHNDGTIAGQFAVKTNLIVGTGADAGYGTITVDGTGAQTYTGSTGRTCLLVVNKSSGAFTPAATDLYVQGFTLSAGSFTAPSGTLNVGGNWSSSVTIFGHTAGTFTHNSGTVEFNPTLISCANPTLTVDIIPATAFYNFTVNGLAGCGINATLSTGTGDVVACTNNFTHTDGIISGAFSFQGNLSIGAGADGGTGTITANGTGAQTHYQAAGSPRTCQLIVNKSSGALTPAVGSTNLTLQGFQLTAGSFTAPSGTLNVGGQWASSLTIFGHSAGTFTHNNGTVEWNPTLISCANPTFTVDIIPATLFYNFIVNGIAGCGINATLSTAAGDVVACANNFTHTDGIIAGNFSFQNNLILNAGGDGGTGTLTANGTGAQTYSAASATPRTCQLIVNKSSGALTPAGGTTDLSTQGFQLTAGSFTAPTGTLNVGGPWATSLTIFGHSAGTYTHNNGTVEFNPSLISCANPTFTIDVIPATLLYNFVVNGTAGCGINATVSTATGDVVACANNFTHTDGIIAGNFSFQNNLIINTGADGGTGIILANGTGAQTFYQAVGSPRTCQLHVNKSSGALTPAVGATDLRTQGFQLIAGSFTAPTGTLNVGGPWSTSLTIFGHSGGTYTHNNGTVEFNPNLISCANPTFTVDVIPSTLLYNFIVNGNAGCGINATVSTAAGDVVQGVNDFTHTDGIIAGNFAFYNNLIINAGADGGTGIILANGTGAQTFYQAVGSPRTCQLHVNKSSGAFTPAVGATDLRTQGFQLIAGSFTAPSGTLNVGGPWATSLTIFGHSGGTYTHNNGTVEFNPNLISCANPTFTVDVIPSTLLYHFVVNGLAGCGINATVSTAAGDVVQGAGDFTHTDGIIAGNFAFYGNLSIGVGADGGTGIILANGTGAQTFYQAAGTPRTCQVHVNKSSGAFTPAVGATDLRTQGFQLIAGSFTAPSGTLNVGGPWATSLTIFGHSGGTYTHNNGTVEFNPNLISCANPTFTVDVIPSTLLYHFVVNGIAGCGINATVSTAAGDVVQGAGDFTHTDGIIAGNFAFYGNLSIGVGADGGTGIILANGTGAQTYYQAAGTPRTCQVHVNKSAGAFTPAVGATDLRTQGFQLIAGSFTAPSGTLNVGGPWATSLTIFGHSGGTYTHNNGTVEFNPNLISCANPTFTIDVIPSTLLYNFIVNGNAGCGINATVSTAAGDVVQGAGDFTHTDGIIAGNFAFYGNLTINAGADGGTGTITANGSGGQTYYQAAGTPRTCQLIVTKSAGAMTPAVGTTDLLVQGFSLTAGSFTAPTGTLNVGGNWSTSLTIFGHTGGTYTHNNGTVEFNPSLISCANPTFTFDVITATQLYNFRVNGQAGCGINATMTTAAGDTLDVANTLTYTDGVCNGRIEAGGNTTVVSTFDGGTGRLIFKGSNAQNFDLTGATSLFDGPVVMNKTSNSVTLLSACQLDAASQTITWNSGIMNTTSTNLLIIGLTVTSGFGNANSFANGPVRKIGNTSFTFPIGKGTKFGQVFMTTPSLTTDQFTAEYFGTNPNGTWNTSTKEATVNAVSTCEYWVVERTLGSSNVGIRLSWDNSRSCAVTNINEQRVGQWNGSQWINQGSNGSPTGNTTAGTVQSCGTISTFGASNPFTNITSYITTASYSGSPFCTSVSSPQAVTFSGLSGGTYSASPAGLTINSGTGEITPSTSTAGTYTVSYTVTTAVACVNPLATASVTVTTLPAATISYLTSPWCITNASAQAVTRTGTSGGTYSSTSGLTINPATGAVTPNTSTAGTYTVTYTIAAAGGCGTVTPTASVTVTPLPTITYSGSPFCNSLVAAQSVTRTGVAGGSYSASPAGLTLVAASGDITPSSSTANTYTVTYTYPASGGCAASTTNTSVTVTTLPAATISYAGTPFCTTVGTAQSVTRTGTAGGTYSAPAGLSLNTSSGAVTPSSSTAGTYTVTYTIAAAGGCAAVTPTASVTVTQLPTASISYSGSPWCLSSGGTKSVSLTGTGGGAYSSSAGLSINGSSGLINVAGSSTGSYTVGYAIAASGGCAAVNASTSVSINGDVGIPTVPSGAATVCQGGGPLAYTTTATNYTSLSWTISGVGNSISGSGTSVNAVLDPTYSGTATIGITAYGCGSPQGPITASLVVNPTGTWLGTTSNWNTASNWCGGVPTITTNVIVPTGAVNMPQVNSNSFCNNLTIQSSASLTVNGSNNLTIGGAVTNAGTFTPSSTSTVDYSSSGSQTVLPVNYANLVTSGAGTKVFSGNIGISGTFTPGAAAHTTTGSTIDFNGSSPQNIPTFGFYNLTTSGTSTKSLTGDPTIDGQLTLTNGLLSLGNHVLTLNGTLNSGGTGNLAGNCTSEIVVGGTGAAGALRFATGQNTLGRLTLTRSSAGTVALGTDVNICNELDLSIGKVVIGSYNLTLLSGAVSTNQNDNSYVQTLDQMDPTGAGFFIREMTAGGGEFTAPVGTSTYTPAYINNVGTTRNFKIRVFNGVYEHGIQGPAVTNIDASVNKTWEIEPLAGAGTPNVSIRLQWGDADENLDFPTVRQNNRAYMGKNEGGPADLWIPQNIYGRQLATAPYSLMTSGVTTFSKFAIGSEEEPLPVVMGDLSLEQLPKANRLSWKSYSERGALYYEVYRSADGKTFEPVDRLDAKGTAANYRYDDPSTSSKTLYYKVKFVGEARGDEQWTNVVVVKAGYQTAYNFYPNPVHTQLTISNDRLVEGDDVTVVITDLKGAIYSKVETKVHGGKVEIHVADLPTGVYLVEGFSNGESTGKRKITKM